MRASDVLLVAAGCDCEMSRTGTPMANQIIRNQINLTLIGAPGSGKGTYGSYLVKSLNAKFLSVGDLLRDHVQRKTKIGMEVALAQKRGELAIDHTVAKAMHDSLDNIETLNVFRRSRHVGFIIDGFPRTHYQARLISPMKGTPVEAETFPEHLRVHYAVSIQVPDSICLKKILGRRECSVCRKDINVCNIDEDGFRMPPILPDPPCAW